MVMAPTAITVAGRGARLLDKLSGFYSPPKEVLPALSERAAILLSILFTLLYVAPFYISPVLRATPISSRDAPSVIRARVRAVMATCIFCTIIAVFVLLEYGHFSLRDLLRLTGMWPANAVDCAKVLALTAVLFVGPLFETLVAEGEWRHIGPSAFKATLWDSWTGYRNLLVAPISEEYVFRSLVISLCLLAKVEPVRIVFISPLIFGLAHIHHLAEYVSTHTLPGRRIPSAQIVLVGIVRSLFQFTYSTLFGYFAAFVFLRTGNVWAATLAHMFCNWMGFPRVWGRVGISQPPMQHMTPDVAQGKRYENGNGVVKVGTAAMIEPNDSADGFSASVPQQQPNAFLSVVYYSLLPIGAFGFHTLLWVLTESDNALVGF